MPLFIFKNKWYKEEQETPVEAPENVNVITIKKEPEDTQDEFEEPVLVAISASVVTIKKEPNDTQLEVPVQAAISTNVVTIKKEPKDTQLQVPVIPAVSANVVIKTERDDTLLIPELSAVSSNAVTIIKESDDTVFKLPILPAVFAEKKRQETKKASKKAQDIGKKKARASSRNTKDNVGNRKLRALEYGREQLPIQRQAKNEGFRPSISKHSTRKGTSFVNNSLDSSLRLRYPNIPNHNYVPNEFYDSKAPPTPPPGHLDIKPDVKSDIKPDVKPDIKPDLRPIRRRSERIAAASALAISSSATTPTKRDKKQAADEIKYQPPKPKKSKSNAAEPPDPYETTYCLCDDVAFGRMIACDNYLCPVEWCHYKCVGVLRRLKQDWYCPKCRGDKPNIMMTMPLFLIVLDRYNREQIAKYYGLPQNRTQLPPV